MPTHPHDNADDARAHRLWQARQLLLQTGFIEGPDGDWHRPEELTPADPDGDALS